MKLQPTTRSLLVLLKEEGIIRVKRNSDRAPTKHIDKVYEDFKTLANSGDIKLFESFGGDSKEVIIVSSSKDLKSFIV